LWNSGRRPDPAGCGSKLMIIKILAAAAALTMLAAGAAKAQDYGTPPYGSSAYVYNGGSCGGFTIAGGYAGVTLLGIDFGVSGRARINGDCGGGYSGAAYAPPPPYQAPAYPQPVYQSQGYQGGYAPAAYAPPSYGYPQPAYGYGQPCGCQGQPLAVYQPY
jgi:hypothetical protein